MALFIIIYHFTIPTPLAIHMGIIILCCGCRLCSTEAWCKSVHSESELEFIPLNTLLKQLLTALQQNVLSEKYEYERHQCKAVWYLWSYNISRWPSIISASDIQTGQSGKGEIWAMKRTYRFLQRSLYLYDILEKQHTFRRLLIVQNEITIFIDA